MRNDQRSIRVETKIRKFAFTFSRKLRLEKDKQKSKKDLKKNLKKTQKDLKKTIKRYKKIQKDTKTQEKDDKKIEIRKKDYDKFVWCYVDQNICVFCALIFSPFYHNCHVL